MDFISVLEAKAGKKEAGSANQVLTAVLPGRRWILRLVQADEGILTVKKPDDIEYNCFKRTDRPDRKGNKPCEDTARRAVSWSRRC